METHAAGGTQGGQDGREDADEGLQDELPENFGQFTAKNFQTGEKEKKKVKVQKQDNEVNVEVPQASSPLSINITIPTAQQVNINPQRVINRVEGENDSNKTE